MISHHLVDNVLSPTGIPESIDKMVKVYDVSHREISPDWLLIGSDLGMDSAIVSPFASSIARPGWQGKLPLNDLNTILP